MKKIILLFALLISFTAVSFGQSKYKMFQLVYLKPSPSADLNAAKKAMAAHNEKFHKDGAFEAHVWSNLTGQMQGTWVWVMGPSTFTDYDNRPNDPDHDSDWQNVVKGNFKMVANEYWKQDAELSYAPEGHTFGDKVVWTVYDLKPGDSYRFKEMVTKIIKVYTEKKYDHDFTVYWNRFDNTDGRDVVIEGSFNKWAFLDKETNMKKDFEDVHGQGSWWRLVEEYRDIIESSYDELSVKIQ